MTQTKQSKPNIFARIGKYFRDTAGELRKVTWPTPREALNMTKVVIIVMVVMATLLGVLDFLFSTLIRLLLNA